MMITAAVSSFWKPFNLFMANFGCCHSVLKNKLFKQYCCFVYGAPLWGVYYQIIMNQFVLFEEKH